MVIESKITVRDASVEDLPEVVAIYNSTVSGRMVTADTEEVSADSKKQWFLEHSPNFRPLWVVEYEGKIIGWLSFQSFYGRPAYKKTAELSIYIREGYRRKGLGSILLKKAVEECPRLGIETLVGFIFGHNVQSLELTLRSGFQRWGLLPGVAELDGVPRDLVIVGRKIQGKNTKEGS